MKINKNNNIGNINTNTATDDVGSWNLISLFKRLLSTKLPDIIDGKIPVDIGANNSSPANVDLNYVSDGDANGVFYYLGTNGNQESWVNPHTNSRIFLSGSGSPFGSIDVLVNRQFSNNNAFYSEDIPNSWVQIDLTANYSLLINRYSIQNTDAFITVNWAFQASNDASTWNTLDTVTNNPATAGVWITRQITTSTSYRYFRIQMSGLDSNGSNYLTFSEIEIYGTLTNNNANQNSLFISQEQVKTAIETATNIDDIETALTTINANIDTVRETTNNLNIDFGQTGDTAATSDIGVFSLVSLFKRLLSVKLPNSISGKIPTLADINPNSLPGDQNEGQLVNIITRDTISRIEGSGGSPINTIGGFQQFVFDNYRSIVIQYNVVVSPSSSIQLIIEFSATNAGTFFTNVSSTNETFTYTTSQVDSVVIQDFPAGVIRLRAVNITGTASVSSSVYAAHN